MLVIHQNIRTYGLMILLILAGSSLCSKTYAQEIKGIVYELESSQLLPAVTVKNLRTKETTATDQEGKFTILGKINDLLSFTQAGYEVDTAFIYEEGIQRIYLQRDDKTIAIDEVVVSRLTDSRLAAEIARAKREGQITEASQSRGGLRISLSRLFGNSSKLARKNLDLLLAEQNERKVDRYFNEQAIRAVVPLSVSEMALFREQFRPSIAFIETASPEDIRLYILDAYAKFINKP